MPYKEYKMSIKVKISDSEWVVAQALWDTGPTSCPELVRIVQVSHDWHANTIATMITRLEKKGVIASRGEGRAKEIFPRMKRSACIRQESRSFLNRLFQGDSASAAAYFIEDTDLSREQLKALKDLLEQKSRENKAGKHG